MTCASGATGSSAPATISRVELGLRAFRAQRTIDALTQLSSAIRKRKAELST